MVLALCCGLPILRRMITRVIFNSAANVQAIQAAILTAQTTEVHIESDSEEDEHTV